MFLYPEINLVLSKKVKTELSNKKFGLLFPTYSNSLLYIKIDVTACKILFGKTEPSDKSRHLLGRKFCPSVSATQHVFEVEFFNPIQSIQSAKDTLSFPFE